MHEGDNTTKKGGCIIELTLYSIKKYSKKMMHVKYF